MTICGICNKYEALDCGANTLPRCKGCWRRHRSPQWLHEDHRIQETRDLVAEVRATATQWMTDPDPALRAAAQVLATVARDIGDLPA